MQIGTGNTLLHISIILLIRMIMVKGHACLEHPALTDPHQRYKAASIWELNQIKFLTGSRLCTKVDLLQGLLGAASSKPTSLLTIGMPTLHDRIVALQAQPQTPWSSVKGTDESGQYQTVKATEYPAKMCEAIAWTFHDAYTYENKTDSTIRQQADEAFGLQANDLFVPSDPYIDIEIGQDFAEQHYYNTQ
jgi:hypothetical protein